MPAFLVKFLTPLAPYLAAGFLLLFAAASTIHLRHELTKAASANAALVETNQANAAALAAYQAQNVKFNAALDTLGAQTLDRQAATAEIYQRIDAAPAAADAPVAPVLAQALADIAKMQAAAK
jgi:hypothetical protein